MSQGAINISVDIKRAKNKLKGFEKIVDKAAKTSLKRTAKTMKTFAVREVTKSTGLKRAKVLKMINLFITFRPELSAVIRPLKRHPNLVEFMTDAQVKAALIRVSKKGGRVRAKGKGIRAKAWGKSKVYEGAFIGRGRRSGKLLVFAREGEGRESPVRALPGASAYTEFGRDVLMNTMKMKARATFKKEFNRNIKFFLSRMK